MIYKLGLTAESKVNIRNTSIIVNGSVVIEKKKSEKKMRKNLCHLVALQLIDFVLWMATNVEKEISLFLLSIERKTSHGTSIFIKPKKEIFFI